MADPPFSASYLQSFRRISSFFCGFAFFEPIWEVVKHCPAGTLQRFLQSVPHGYAQPAEPVVHIPVVSSG